MMVLHPNMPNVPADLLSHFNKGLVALFLGAGVSMPAGAPSWEALTAPLKARLKYKGVEKLELPQVMSLSANKLGRAEVRDLLKQELDALRGLSLHEQIVKLPTDLILTTNYDPYLHEAARVQGREHEVIKNDAMITSCGDSRLKIVHLYGDTDDPLTTEEDLITFDRKHPALAMLLEHTLLTRTVLFLGFSLRDYNVLNHLLTAHTLVGGSERARRHYAFLLSPKDDYNEAMIELWQSRSLNIFGIREVPLDQMSETFRTFVTNLAQAVVQKTHAEIERELVAEREERRCFDRADRGMPLHMRRESTFSVLAIPDEPGLDGLTPDGHQVGKQRKDLYRKWLDKGGRIDLILNADMAYAGSVRDYDARQQLVRFRELKAFLEAHVETGLSVVIRSNPRPRDTYASLDQEVLILSETPAGVDGKAYKCASVVRDQIAVRVFNDMFDQELDSLLPPGDGPQITDARRHAGNRATLVKIDAAITSLEARLRAADGDSRSPA